MAKKKLHVDASGTHDMDAVTSITPVAVRAKDGKESQVGFLHFSSGGGVQTSTDYDELVKKWTDADGE